jgi:F0F1-type ATP synthase membrane subunit b/b'
VYVQIEKNIAQARQATESAMAASDEAQKQITAIRKTLDSILQEVQQVATSR